MSNEVELKAPLSYQVGLGRINEMVISSHFMHKLSQDHSLCLYDEYTFRSKKLAITHQVVTDKLLPTLKSACVEFCADRAAAAKRRARAKYSTYGHVSEDNIGVSEIITEALLDKEFSRNGERYNSRVDLNARVKRMVEEKHTIDMVIPALPFKIPSPLKSRGNLPDLGEINFLLGVYEVARTLEIICQSEIGDRRKINVCFTIISDGSRFDDIINESDDTPKAYQERLKGWIAALQIDEYVRLVDYRCVLKGKLPAETWAEKLALFRQARESYARALWPVFDPNDMRSSFQAATEVELDPEYGNIEGRFVSLLKSLVHTIKYKVLEKLPCNSESERLQIYRELTSHIFDSYDSPSSGKTAQFGIKFPRGVDNELKLDAKERLRIAMLTEAWRATINYISEIKSDRDLAEDPITTCFPDYLRWTIHAKPGQLAMATPPILGLNVQPWAGSAVFRRTGKGGIRLCTLPLLVLEASEAIPVVLQESSETNAYLQPLFYIDKELLASEVADFLVLLERSYTRKRFS